MFLNCSLPRGAWRGMALALATACLLGGEAFAAPVSVTPTTVTLTPQKATELLSLINEGDEQLRFELTAYAWEQAPDGETKLAPTQDIVFFPPLLSVPPNQTAKVRVGATAPFSGVEKSYRLIIQQLPNAANPASGVQIQILTKFSMPLFMQPLGTHAVPAIDSANAAAGVFSFAVRDSGTQHFMLQHVRATGTDASGQKTFEAMADGWYVLAGGERDYRLAIAEGDCRRTSRIDIEAITDKEPVKAQFPLAGSGCGAHSKATAFLSAQGTGPAAKQ